MKKLFTLGAAAVISMSFAVSVMAERYVGGDISLLPTNIEAGAKYKDFNGKAIPDFLPWCKEQGMNAMRVRLFVDPSKYHGEDADPNTCQTLEYILPLCQQIKEAGLKLMLDFHYSDTWADPAKQYTPADWKDLTDEQLYDKIYEYTLESLNALNEVGATPDFIQPGNEISYGMLWGPEGTSPSQQKKTLSGSDANWDRLGNLLNRAIQACHEACPEAQIVIHTERIKQVSVLKNFYDRMRDMNVDYDIIGLSYYPYFHGDISVLNSALTSLESLYPDKQIMIVETGYPYKWEVPGTTVDLKDKYPYTEDGQDKFAQALVSTLESHKNVDGLFWWWMEYNAFGTSLSGWYNAPLFDSTTGKVTKAFKTICSFGAGSSLTLPVAEGSHERTLYYRLDGTFAGHEPNLLGQGMYIKKQGNSVEKTIRK